MFVNDLIDKLPKDIEIYIDGVRLTKDNKGLVNTSNLVIKIEPVYFNCQIRVYIKTEAPQDEAKRVAREFVDKLKSGYFDELQQKEDEYIEKLFSVSNFAGEKEDS